MTPFQGEDLIMVGKLRALANIFVELQDKRHMADYDNATSWTFTQAMKRYLFTSLNWRYYLVSVG
jgi:hypothetical protein